MFDYKKIIVVGCPGAGKSTFSRKLSAVTGIQLHYLDYIYWNEDASHISRASLIREQKKIFKNDSYIIDGNFKSTLELRLKHADLVIFFDLPTDVCVYGATHRINRTELKCELPDNEELVEFIKGFNDNVKPRMLELFEKYSSNVVTFHSHKDADNYIDKLYDLTLKAGNGVFNHRVAGVIINDNKILAQMNMADNSYYLVGGRVRFGESTEEALTREIKEELDVDIKDFHPLWVNECFFVDNGIRFHEVGIYYLIRNISIPNYSFSKQEGNRTNYYEWLDIDRINDYTLYPEFIKNEINNIDSFKLIITKEE